MPLFPPGTSALLGLRARSGSCQLAAACMLALGCGEGGIGSMASPASAAGAQLSAPAVVSLSPNATRFIEALGARDLLVGVDPASSQSLSGKPLPKVDLQGALQLAPDLILVDELPRPKPTEQPSSGSAEYVEFAPDSLEELFALSRTLGKRLVGPARATRFELDIARPLARIGGAPFEGDKPRVAAVLGLAPTRLAGGHSFATDAIEIAGGTSVTHEAHLTEDFEPNHEDWLRLAPNLLLVLSAEEMPSHAKRDARAALPPEYPVLFFPFDPASFWSEEPVQTVTRLRSLLMAHVQGKTGSSPHTPR